MKGRTELFGISVPNLYGGFGENQKVMLAKTIAEIHGRELFKINELINNNRERFRDGEHVIDLKNNKEVAILLKDSEIMTQNAINASTNIFLLSQRGYIRLLKIMDDDIAWEKWDVIEREYFDLKEQQTETMSQLEIMVHSAQILLEQEKAIQQISAAQMHQAEEIQGIREVVALKPHDWRRDSTALLLKMAQKLGDNAHIQGLRAESYKLLNERFGVSLEQRLRNKRRRMAEEGASKSKRDKLNPLDVITEDKKLIEGYMAIIKEMAIKYGL
jgi:hypothetical protein